MGDFVPEEGDVVGAGHVVGDIDLAVLATFHDDALRGFVDLYFRACWVVCDLRQGEVVACDDGKTVVFVCFTAGEG